MTVQEAIRILECMNEAFPEEDGDDRGKAISMAIKSLEMSKENS